MKLRSLSIIGELMKLRSLSIIAATTILFARPLEAQRFEYAPGTSRYKLTAVNKLTQEAQGQKVEQQVTSEQKLTVTLGRQSRDTLSFAMTLDSAKVSTTAGPPPDLSALLGLKVTGVLSPLGVIYASKAPEGPGSELTGPLADEMTRFLPRLRPTLTIGTTWTDTTAGKVNQMGISLDRTVITTSQVVGDTTYLGERAWRIERTTQATFAGSGTTQGQPLTMEGIAKGSDNLYIARNGVYLGGLMNNAATIKVTLVANGVEVGLTQNQNTTITRVK
ncbi:MAG: hypothetical protein ABR499_07050 [Gemmatimonadaceae bacterium]